MTAPTPTEQATLDRIEAAPDAEESLTERVARAIWRAGTEDEYPGVDFDSLWPKVVARFPEDAAAFRHLADAAIAVMRGES